MTRVLVGSRQDLQAAAAELGRWFMPKSAAEFQQAWRTCSLLPDPLVVFAPAGPGKKDSWLFPRADRHLAFEDAVPAAWQTWVKKHKLPLEHVSFSKNALKQALVEGNPAANLPKLTPAAADFVLEAFPHGLAAVQAFAQVLVAAELPQPIPLTSVQALWPYDAGLTKKYDVAFTDFKYQLGTLKGLKLALKVQEKNAIPALSILENVYCKQHPELLKYMKIVREAFKEKRYGARVALFLFAWACYQEARCPSLAKTPESALQRLNLRYQLWSIPSSASSELPAMTC